MTCGGSLGTANPCLNPLVQIGQNGYKPRVAGQFVGRGKRIRTSGPCLPKALTLALSHDFPASRVSKPAHVMGYVLVRFTVGGSSLTLDPCLKFGPASRLRNVMPALTKRERPAHG